MTRDEHLEWSKKRAIEYCESNDIQQAYASMVSDLGKHPELANHPAIKLGIIMMSLTGNLNTQHSMRRFIESFN